jgi:MtaA/CmuA family methyltransferase
MTGKERIVHAMKCEETDRIPWLPFVGVHGGKLLDLSATEYLKSPDHLAAGIAETVRRYQPDGVPVAFDLQIEAEVLGCELNWQDETPPAVISHPLAQGVSLAELSVPGPDAGRIATVLEAARKIRAAHPDLAVYGLITGPFTLALHLLGTDIFMRMFDEPDSVHETMRFAMEVGQAMAGYYLDAGCDVVAVVDPMTSQIGPDQFVQFVSPYAQPLFEHIRAAGGLGSFFVCGHAEQNLQVMCDCTPDNVSVDENIPLETIRDICLPRNVSFGGNLQLTSVLLLGQSIDAQRNAVECMEIGGTRGFILAPGCDLPYDTPPENLEAVTQVVLDEYERQAVKTMAVEEVQQDLLDMSEYGQSEKVAVDVITLDSEACAPCQYMVESVKQIAPEFEGIVEWREHKIKYRESLVFMTSLMVRNVPTICIDGQITFVSRIPARDELMAAIQQRILEKLRVRIAQKRGEVILLASPEYVDEETLNTLKGKVRRATDEYGIEIPVRVVDDETEILSHGVLPAQTPAIVTLKYQVRSTRLVPETNVIREWIKDIE